MFNVSDQSNPSDINLGVSQAAPTTGTEVTTTPTRIDPKTASTLSKSEQENAAVNLLASSPMLTPPTVDLSSFADSYNSNSSVGGIGAASASSSAGGISAAALFNSGVDAVTAANMAIEATTHKVISDMLDSWIANLRQLEDEYKAKINDPNYQEMQRLQSADYTANQNRSNSVMATAEYMSSVVSAMNPNPTQVAQPAPALTPDATLKVGTIENTNNYVNKSSPADATNGISTGFVVASTIIAAGAISSPIANPVAQNSNNTISTDPLKDQWAYVTPLVPPDTAAQLAQLGSLFTIGVIYQATAANIAKAAGTGSKPKNLDFAKEYSEKMLTVTASPQFNAFVRTSLVDKLNSAEGLTDARKAELAAIVKTVMLSSALGAYYKIEAGKNSAQEFLSMIRSDPNLGDIVFNNTDVRAKLVKAIQKELGNISDVKERARLLEAMGEYMQTDPSVDSLTEPQSIFSGLLDTTPYGERLSKDAV